MFYPVKIAEALKINLPITSESVLGLQQLKCFETKADLQKLEANVLSFEETLDKLYANA
jgi:hypothetical protein